MGVKSRVACAHVAIISGISGCERYLARGRETPEEKRARRFRSAEAAREAAQAHIGTYPKVVQRAMGFRVEPRP